MNNNINSGCLSWPAIIVALFVFWPVGLFLLIKRFSLDKKAAISAGDSALKTVGIVLAAIGGIGTIACLSEGEGGGAVVALFFVAGGAALIKKANKMKTEANDLKQYLAIIVNGGERQLDVIASVTGKRYNVVKDDIQKMIDKGFLKNAYINENERAVVLTTNTSANVGGQTQATATEAAVQTRVVACPCCGANNTISGSGGECEYCGSPLK